MNEKIKKLKEIIDGTDDLTSRQDSSKAIQNT